MRFRCTSMAAKLGAPILTLSLSLSLSLFLSLSLSFFLSLPTLLSQSALAFAAYRGLVYDTPEFLPYFRAATPIAEIAQLNIGSRPAARTGSARIEDLRAIPWVFSWGQCRVMLPGWYGFGTAVDTWLDSLSATTTPAGREAGMRLLQSMHSSWPYFKSMLSNMAMVLAKTDLAVASR